MPRRRAVLRLARRRPPRALRGSSPRSVAPRPERSRSRSLLGRRLQAVERRDPELASRSGRPSSGRRPEAGGSRRRPAGTSPRRFVSACISPSSTTSTTFARSSCRSRAAPSPFPSSASSAIGAGVTRGSARRAAVRDDLERLLAEDLGEVGEEVELVGELAVPGQRLSHPAMIRRCLAPSSASRPTTSARTWSR